MSDKDTHAEQAAELLRLVDQISDWSRKHLRKKYRARYDWLTLQLGSLRTLAKQKPEQAGAALLGAKAMWHMMFEDARSGARQRNIQGLPLAHEFETRETLISKIDVLCKEHPGKNITWIRDKIAGEYGYSGAKAIARKTKWYNPTK